MVHSNDGQKEETLWDGLSKLAKAVGTFGTPFTLVFMGNVIMILAILFLQTQTNWLWVVASLFAFFEVALGFYLYSKKHRLENAP
jgi:hypothetical protein